MQELELKGGIGEEHPPEDKNDFLKNPTAPVAVAEKPVFHIGCGDRCTCSREVDSGESYT